MSWFASKPKPVVEINRESADNTKDFASMDTAERVAHQLKFAGKWKRVSGEGIRDMLVFVGVPWLVSALAASQFMKSMFCSFVPPDDPTRKMMALNEDGGTEDEIEFDKIMVVPAKRGPPRNNERLVRWDEKGRIVLQVKDHEVSAQKKHTITITNTRTMIQPNLIHIHMHALKNDMEEKECDWTMERVE
jgi:hypothetical protein